MIAKTSCTDLNVGIGHADKTAEGAAQVFIQRGGPSFSGCESGHEMAESNTENLMEERYAIREEGIF